MSLYSQLVQHIANELTLEPTRAISRDHLHAGQRAIIEQLNRFNVLACGRRFGKTTLGKHVIIEQALEGKRCWWVSPTFGMSSQVWRDIKNTLRPITTMKINESERRIDLPNGGMIAVRSAHNAERLRGEGLDFAVLDEHAFMTPYVWSDVVRPMMLTTKGGAFFLSTPYGKNHFFDLYGIGLDDTEHEWSSFHATSYDNPLIDPDEIESMRRKSTARTFQEEIMAEFNDSDGAVFRNVRACAIASEQTQPVEGHNYVFGVDWGRDNDYTVIAIIDTTTSELVALERFNKIDYTFQQSRITSLYKRWNPLKVIAESNAMGQPNIDALRRAGVPIKPFATTQKSKTSIIERLALAFETEAIKIINNPILIHELTSYEQSRTQAGAFKFSAPEGGHDDTVMALAIAWSDASRAIADDIPVITF